MAGTGQDGLHQCIQYSSAKFHAGVGSIAQDLPELYNYVSSSYVSPSSLRFGEYILSSEEGVQQGEPLA